MAKETVVDIEGKHLKLSNLDKVLYPEAGFTKGQVIDYYVRIAPVLLPHLRGRPLTMKRYPNGVSGPYFYEKNCPEHRPEWVQTARVWSSGNHKWMNYCLAEDLPTLVWAANLADLELHTSLSLGADILRPTFLVFDLDPGLPANIVQCCQVGLWLRDIFAKLSLQSFAKTSGSKGLQIYVPLNTAVTYDQTKLFAHELARLLERQYPDLVVSDMKKSLRTGKVLVDWSQNDDHKTTVCVYSLRAKERPTASTPVKWDEVETCLKKSDANRLVFESDEVLARAKKHGDLFEPVLKLKQKMPPVEVLQQLESDAAAKPSPATKRAATPPESLKESKGKKTATHGKSGSVALRRLSSSDRMRHRP
ncbi:MAG: non-homologous end-joining DNA ligase [Candidatus Korobacteraceae bacterium]